MSEQRCIKIKHTEIELPADEEKLIEIVVGLLSGPSATPLGVRLGGRTTKPVSAEEQRTIDAIGSPTDAGADQGRVKTRGRRGGGLRRPSDDFIDPSRRELINDVCKAGQSDDLFSAAVRRAKTLGDRCVITIYLAMERVEVSGLVISEVASVLSRKFRFPTTLNAVGLALARMAKRSESALVSATEARWDRTKTEYWLTEPGITYAKSLVNTSQT